MSGWKKKRGLCRVQIISADITRFISEAVKRGIHVSMLTFPDPLTAAFFTSYKDIRSLKAFSKSSGAELKLLHIRGLLLLGKGSLKRPVLMATILAVLILTWVIPTRVLFIQIDGNHQIPAKELMECANTAGIRFGVSCKEVRSERVKNQMLQQLPQLQWVGVTTKGCVATVTVMEGAVPRKTEAVPKVSHIVSSTDGIITQMVTVKGNPLCKTGQAVKKGQTLISGYWDLGLMIRATRSEGEVYAMTKREVSAKSLPEVLCRGEFQAEEKHYSIIIGKKLINFHNSSGILPPGCVKMYEQIPLTLADGLSLPVTLLVESRYYYTLDSVSNEEDTQIAQKLVKDYLLQNMIAGTVLRSDAQWEDANTVHIQYICHEMIGQEVAEEHMEYNG